MPRSPLRRRLLLLAGATAVALLLAELLFRAVEPPTRPGQVVLYAANGQRVPGGEILYFGARMLETDGELNSELQEPHGMLQANLRQSMGYENPKPRWPYFDHNGAVALDTNHLGFRDLEFAAVKPAGEFRVLALGDSFTFGQGVRLDLIWPQLLEATLRGELARPVEVINAGFAAGRGVRSPDGYDRWLAAHGIRLQPDLVLVGLCLNDLGDSVPMLSYVPLPAQPVLGGFSHLLDYLVWSVRVRATPKQRVDPCAGVREHPEQWQGTQRGLLAMQELLAGHGVPLVVAVFPMLSELGDGYPYGPLHDLAVAFCREHGIRCVDLRHVFDGHDDMELWVHFADQHPNHVGHRLMAAAIHDYLVSERLLPAR